MKTTLREALWNMDDSILTDSNCNLQEIDIDKEKIKNDVLAKIKADSTKKAHPKKQFRIFLIAAILFAIAVLGGTTVYAALNFDVIFKEFFGGNMNSAGLYDSNNVSVTCEDENLNVNLLGITGDDKKIYAAIEVTNKDGSALTDEGFENPYHIFATPHILEDPTNPGCTFECKDKNGNSPERCNGIINYSLSPDRRTLKLCILAMNGDENMSLQDGTMHIVSDCFGARKVYEKIATRVDFELANEYGAGYGWDKEWSEIEKRIAEVEASLEEQGITEYCTETIGNDKCVVKHAGFPLSFEMDIELNYEKDNIIEKSLTVEDAPDFISENATEMKMEITPFGLNFYGKCDPNITSPRPLDDYCYKTFDYSDDSKITLEDGTVYYLYAFGLDTEGKKDGYYTEEKVFNLATIPGPPHYHSQVNLINPDEVVSVMINGNEVYSK